MPKLEISSESYTEFQKLAAAQKFFSDFISDINQYIVQIQNFLWVYTEFQNGFRKFQLLPL